MCLSFPANHNLFPEYVELEPTIRKKLSLSLRSAHLVDLASMSRFDAGGDLAAVVNVPPLPPSALPRHRAEGVRSTLLRPHGRLPRPRLVGTSSGNFRRGTMRRAVVCRTD